MLNIYDYYAKDNKDNIVKIKKGDKRCRKV